ncbi:PA0069 family radical SAM protein [Bordetella holmesii]|uniref:Radical SAM domain protein n=4 Tax=Bordetella holmesii TaxID=35814 RepID=A0A158M7Z3_9BORD|nr:PA0069 family radical SAM protein [Bordetella holmesii]AHV92296.1 radical SAM superfamily protein [Bordetella holmesii ATCC 51541]AIT27151.1 radical SAM superfamily protein [Bordetella holmesii 44057]EWM41974.1 radical SAM superfamily protein [Bordetella holmesii 41130]EWM47735.1 radical SAM superfamily protein [Bordetella holmesii 35009]EWM51905.1 radical SAM superfamily protein [Bordetella holmesii 70147]
MMSTEHSLSAGYGSPAAAPAASRGRGAVTNVRHRFEQVEREAFDDGWFGGDDSPAAFDASLDEIQDEPKRPPRSEPAEAEALGVTEMAPEPGRPSAAVGLPQSATQHFIPVVAVPRTTVRPEQARKLLSRNDSPDIPFDVAVNPYRGCEHGCVYCYARPTHAYLGYSPGLDFETRLVAKANAVQALRAELARPSYKVSPINIGSATDVYQPIERTWRLTRGLLELMVETRHPLTLVTKNSLVERDLDLLTTLARDRLVTVFISITTLDADMARTLEPRASAPWRRIETVRKLAEAGIPVGVLVAPVIPFINDESMEQILEAASAAGACSASYTVVRLPWEVKDVFETWLHTHFPDRAQRVLHRIEDMREGKRNDSSFDTRMRGTGIWADLLRQRFELAVRNLGLGRLRPELALDHFVPPVIAATVRRGRGSASDAAREAGQMALFED